MSMYCALILFRSDFGALQIIYLLTYLLTYFIICDKYRRRRLHLVVKRQNASLN